MLYFEDLTCGTRIELPKIEITQEMRDAHVALYGEDWPAEVAEVPINRGVIPGPMVMAIAGGLMGKHGNLAIYYMLEYKAVKFHRPVCVGDAVRIRTDITGRDLLQGKKYGHVFAHQAIHNQRNELACERYLTYGILLRA